jgi:hypothetical protein
MLSLILFTDNRKCTVHVLKKLKGKFDPKTCHEGVEGEQR